MERFTLKQPTLDDYHRQVAALTDAVHNSWRLPFKRYARWAITGPLQRRVDAGADLNISLWRWPLRRLKISSRFAVASAAASLGPADITQAHLDGWLVEFPTHRAELRGFVNWCSNHHYMRPLLRVDAATTRETRRTLDHDERLDLARRLLAEGEDRIARLAGIFVVLFGQTLTRAARIRIDAIQITPNGVELQLGTMPIRLREPLAQLALDVVAAATHVGSPWLFPSTQGGRPLSANRLAERLRIVGIRTPLHARNGARAALAEQMPPTLVAQTVGISNGAADGWVKAVGASRATYVGLLQ